MGRKKAEEAPAEQQEAKPENRSPSWAIYARIDTDLKAEFEEYQAQFDYPPQLSRVIEKALRKLFADSKALRKRNGH